MEIKYVYIILIIILVYLLPEIISILIIMGAGFASLIYIGMNMINERIEKDQIKRKLINEEESPPKRFYPEITNPNDRRNAVDESNDANLKMINDMYPSEENIKTIDNYYSKLPYEEQFADYGLAKAQKNLLNHSDVARNNESNFNYTKFAKFFGDETEIKYNDAWYGPDY